MYSLRGIVNMCVGVAGFLPCNSRSILGEIQTNLSHAKLCVNWMGRKNLATTIDCGHLKDKQVEAINYVSAHDNETLPSCISCVVLLRFLREIGC